MLPTLRAAAARLLIVASSLAAAHLAGCSSEEPSAACAGVERDGTCYAKCNEATDCQAGQRCVAPAGYPEGGCFATCASVVDCAIGSDCVDRSTMSGEAGKFCLSRKYLTDAAGKPLPEGGEGARCVTDADCDAGHGVRCVDGACKLAYGDVGQSCGAAAPCKEGLGCKNGVCGTCEASTDCDIENGVRCIEGACQLAYGQLTEPCGPKAPCDAGLTCFENQCVVGCDSVNDCEVGTECRAVEGQAFKGACLPGSEEVGPGRYGQPCPNGPVDCDAEAGFVCSNAKPKNGDVAAYCTKNDGCAADADCPVGFWCGGVTKVADAEKGDFDYDTFIRRCQRRVFCSPCETDLDCSGQLGGICVPDANGEKFCSISCDPNSNSCIIGAGCVDSGDGVFACRPDVGYCHAAEPKGCDPCRIDADCGYGALCREGKFGYKPTVRWCSTPCGEPDADGKNTCPVAHNGLEMICLDENERSIGGPFTSEDPNSVYKHCFAPLTVDNSGSADGADPVNPSCGNGRRDGDEECDDDNLSETDGCTTECKVPDACRFTLDDANGDEAPALSQNGMSIPFVPAACKTFLVEGSLEAAGDVDTFKFKLTNNQSAWVEVFTDALNTCSADLVAESRGGTVDLKVPCEQLSQDIKNLADQKLCPDGKLGCGSCTKPGVCGTCDDDGGIGNCPRMLVSTSTSYGQYTIKYDSTDKTIRLYAKNPEVTVGKYIILVNRLPYDSAQQSPKYSPGLSCW